MAGNLTFDQLKKAVSNGEIDTVLACSVDMQGRLVGKRFLARYFVDSAHQETHGCNYLLANDIDMEPVPGYRAASWSKGYGDFVMKPDLATLRRIPWLEKTALVLCNVLDHHTHEDLPHSPRAILRKQVRRLQERGYLVYTPDPGGLLNQNWKDSPGSICFADGTVAEGPLAVSEVQGYAYDALLRTARLARDVWDDEDYARRLDDLAAGLRERFLRDFWMPEAGFPALALDGEGRRADALGSDAGHLLWSGILDEDRARVTGRRLLEPDFFSGWAVRTLASGQAPYHPLSYHCGSAWPHDNALIALGLARYGLGDEVRALADGLAAAAARCGHRLPEVFAGYGLADAPAPVPYPHSCSPQAWAAATPAALRTALGQV